MNHGKECPLPTPLSLPLSLPNGAKGKSEGNDKKEILIQLNHKQTLGKSIKLLIKGEKR